MNILFLTNSDNGAPEEDAYLINILQKDFAIQVSHPLECEQYLPSTQGVIIRNIWPTHEYQGEWERIKKVILDSGIPTYNPLIGKGDNQGKSHLIDLYKRGFPVIPSADRIEDVGGLPESEWYWIKPKNSCDGHGSEKLTKPELLKKTLNDYVIQPYIEFESEPSFYFIDNVFSYAITIPNRLADEDIKRYTPTKEDLIFAQKFVDWNGLPHGIQRIDAVRTRNGELLLTEVEDIASYLYLLDIDEDKKGVVVRQLVESIKSSLIA